jgi:hypothetical protein
LGEVLRALAGKIHRLLGVPPRLGSSRHSDRSKEDLVPDTSPITGDTYNRLLGEMKHISAAVNGFTSEKCQRTALAALIRAFGVPDAPPFTSSPVQPALSVVPPVVTEQVPDAADQPTETPAAKTPARRKRGGKRTWDPDRSIEFWPEGVQSFKDFVAEKSPKTNDQKNVVAGYWLEQIAGIKEIGLPQVDAAYKVCGWRESADLNASLRTTAHRTHWLETSNMKAIATTPTGRNVVKHEMPIEKDKKPA